MGRQMRFSGFDAKGDDDDYDAPIAWLRAVAEDDPERAGFAPSALGAITGQDARALRAFAAVWELYASCDAKGQAGAIRAARALLSALQPKCRPFARLLIARSLDWGDCDRLWPLVVPPRRTRPRTPEEVLGDRELGRKEADDDGG